MDTSFNPKKEIRSLLGRTPTHPWAALIPQILLWCFRRFCVQKLMLFEGNLEENLCEDILDLVHSYCPKGLEMVSIEWFTPENIEQVASPLEDYMKFMIRFAKHLDASMNGENYTLQDELSEFLDTSIGEIILGWLDKKHLAFFIFPTQTESDDEFTEVQFSKLINSLLMYSYSSKKEEPVIEAPAPAPAPVSLPSLPPLPPLPPPPPPPPPPPAPKQETPLSLLWYLIPIPKPEDEVEPEPPPTPAAVPPVAEPEPKTTIAEVLHRRRTLCVRGRRAQEPRVKTRKTHPAAPTKRE